jgi:pimeloyl-ACP methyl ester carboxylesterase
METHSEVSPLASEKSTIDRSINGVGPALRPLPVPAWLRTGLRAAGAVAPGAAARLAQQIFFTPPRTAIREGERAVLARGTTFTVEVGGRRVAGWAWGEGPAILLAHGWGGHAGQMTALVAPAVAAGCRVVALDLPAHGASEGRVSSLVHFAAALSRAAALWQPVQALVAHSFGAAAGTFALSRGLPARRAVFFAPPSRFDSIWTRFRAAAGVSDEVWRRLMRSAESWLEVSFDGIAPVDLAPRIHLPLLVLHDRGDREVPFAEGAELARTWPGAVLESTEGLGHLRLLKDPACIARALQFAAAGA